MLDTNANNQNECSFFNLVAKGPHMVHINFISLIYKNKVEKPQGSGMTYIIWSISNGLYSKFYNILIVL